MVQEQGVHVEGINFYTGFCVEGHTHAIRGKDRKRAKRNNALWVAEQLGFAGVTRNSLDTVSDRDFALEFCSFASILMMHLSRLSEELVLWSSADFAFVELSDSFCTGSSIMPQKKNPDVPELVR